jgi:hypothetical protein
MENSIHHGRITVNKIEYDFNLFQGTFMNIAQRLQLNKVCTLGALNNTENHK